MTDHHLDDDPQMGLAATIRVLQWRDSALTVLHRYVDRIDSGDVDAVAALFLPEATYDFMGSERQGRDRIAARLRRSLSEFDRTSHHVSNALVEVTGTKATVTASLYAYHLRKQTGEPWHFWGRYVQRLVRDEGRWAIEQMQLIGIDALPLSARERGLFGGLPDRQPVDPS